ncbi:MAG: ribosome biogenesis GTPase Der [Trueperaceae bacterium]|nr:ribosome biogenesis GTPase Der [Trueperaceae bacterium]
MLRVAIVGRPNVGKSTLFNRLIGSREAIVSDRPGVTRDVKEGVVTTDLGNSFILFDTGGVWSGDRWETPIRERIEAAFVNIDLILYCVDGRTGMVPLDHEIASWLRTKSLPVILVATKLDDPKHEETIEMYELHGLGFGEPWPTGAEHARGVLELADAIVDKFPKVEPIPEEEPVRLAIIGRPNVGKSSLLNALVGHERVIVADAPGTTRDSVDVQFHFGGRSFLLIDTAGIRRKPTERLEHYSKLRSEQAIANSDVALLVIDPFELGDHELRLANFAYETGKPVVLAINKWDLVKNEVLKETRRSVNDILLHIAFAPRVFTSAETAFGLHELLATSVRVYNSTRRRIPTSELNRWVEAWVQRQAPPNFRGRPLKLFYTTQADIAPPTFIFSINNASYVTRAYEQYLRNRIREDLDFSEVPVRLVFKTRGRNGTKRIRL